MSSSEVEALGRQLASQLEADQAGAISGKTRRRLLAALVRDYARSTRPDAEGRPAPSTSPLEPGAVTAADVAVTVAGLLKAADVTSFEVAALFDV